MTQELIWGKSGSPHIDGNDIGTINLAMRGIGNYVLDYKDNLKATVASANKVTIGTGVMSFEGRDIIISAAETVTIESGSQGMKRNDIICEHYHRDTSSGVETTNLVAIKGTPASSNPKDPTIPSGTILGGATDAYMPLYRIPLDGITVGTPVQLFEILTPLKTVGDSVTQSGKITPVRGWVVQDQPYWVRIGAVVFLYGTVKPNYGWGTSSKDSPFDLPFKPATFGTQSIAIAGARTGFINFAPRDGEDACWLSAPDNTGDYPAGTYFFLNGTSYLAELPEQLSVTRAKMDWKPPYTNNRIRFERVGSMVFVNGNVKFENTGENNYTKAEETLPTGWIPTDVNTPIQFHGLGVTFSCLFGDPGGVCVMLGNPNSAYATVSGAWVTDDPMPAQLSVTRMLHVETIKAVINLKATNHVMITAPKVDGYRFIAWVASASVGWIGATYIASPTSSSTDVYNASNVQDGNRSVNCTALYQATQLSVTQSIVFHRTSNLGASDTLTISGHVLPNGEGQWLAVVSIDWINSGAFRTSSWWSTNLATMDGWQATQEYMQTCHENIAYEYIGKNAFRAVGNTISYQTPGAIDIGANSWHKGALVFNVKPAQFSVTRITKIMTGSSVVNVNGGSSVILFSTDEFAGMFGRQFNVSRDFFAVMNADGNSAHVHVEGATWDSRYGMYAVFSEKMSGLIRINYVCIIAE